MEYLWEFSKNEPSFRKTNVLKIRKKLKPMKEVQKARHLKKIILSKKKWKIENQSLFNSFHQRQKSTSSLRLFDFNFRKSIIVFHFDSLVKEIFPNLKTKYPIFCFLEMDIFHWIARLKFSFLLTNNSLFIRKRFFPAFSKNWTRMKISRFVKIQIQENFFMKNH